MTIEFVRARWMFPLGRWVAFGVGLTAIVTGVLAGIIDINREDEATSSVHLAGIWAFWVGLAGLAIVGGLLATWWLGQNRREVDAAEEERVGSTGAFVRTPPGVVDWVAIVALPVGGLAPVVGWIVATLLVWTSSTWTHREKLGAAVAALGGPVTAAIALAVIEDVQAPRSVMLLADLVVTIGVGFLPLGAACLLAVRAYSGRPRPTTERVSAPIA